MDKAINNICHVCGADMQRSMNDSIHDTYTFHMVCPNGMCGASRTVHTLDDDAFTYTVNAKHVTIV